MTEHRSSDSVQPPGPWGNKGGDQLSDKKASTVFPPEREVKPVSRERKQK